MKRIIAVVVGCLALDCFAQVSGLNPTNGASPGATNTVTVPATAANEPSGVPPTDPQVVLWIQDSTPAGASLSAPPDDPWVWTNAFWDGSQWVSPYPGSLLHLSPPAEGWHQHWFSEPGLNLAVNPGDWLIAYIYLPLANGPSAVALRWLVGGASAQAPASWGPGVFWCAPTFGTNNSAVTNAFYMGPLPAPGQWARLSVPAAAVAEGSQLVQGMSFSIYDGTAAWDQAGKIVPYLATSATAAATGAAMNEAGQLTQSGPCLNPPNGLVGWWKGDGSTNDFLGLDNGYWQGTAAYMTGEVAQAFYLSGTNDDVIVGASPTLNVGVYDGFTVETWINPSDFGKRPIVEWNSDQGGYTSYGAHFWASQPTPYGSGPGCLYANIIDTAGGSHYVVTAAGLLQTGVWSHVALTYGQASGQACIYLNGGQQVCTDVGVFTPQTSCALYFGARVCGSGEGYWLGGIDEVSLYKCVLSPGQIEAIWSTGNAGKCTNPPSCASQPSGLVGWWKGEGTTNDTLGLDNGWWQGPAGYIPGEVGEAFYLSGANDDVIVGASPTLNVGAGGAFTVEAWINPYDSDNRPIIEWNSDNNGWTSYGAHLWTSQPTPCGTGPGCLYANLIDTSGGSHYVCSPPYLVQTGIWSHVALTYAQDSGVASLWLNGCQVANTNMGSLTPQTSYALYFGARVCGAGEAYWLGGIDEVSLYNCALWPAQIEAICNAGSAGKCIDPTILIAPASQSVPPGANVTFSVDATSELALTYQWTLNGNNIAGATSSIYSTNNAQASAAGTYAVIVKDALGSTTNPATLAVGSPNVWVTQPMGNAITP
jgi:hypothetical protein